VLLQLGDPRQRLRMPRIVVRNQLRRDAKIDQGMHRVVLAGVSRGSSVIGLAVLRPQLDRLRLVGNCLVVIPGGIVGNGAIVEDLRLA